MLELGTKKKFLRLEICDSVVDECLTLSIVSSFIQNLVIQWSDGIILILVTVVPGSDAFSNCVRVYIHVGQTVTLINIFDR